MFKKDVTQVRSFGGGRIRQTGFHAFTITKAYDRDSQSTLSKALHLDVVTDNGESGQIDLWFLGKDGTGLDKNGKPLSALSSINDLMVLTELDNLNAKAAMVDIYDYDVRADVKVKKMAYMDLVGKHIGGVFQMVQEGKRTQVGGEWTTSNTDFVQRPEFKCFTSDTGQSAKEFLDGAEPVSIEKYVAGLDPIKGIAPGDAAIIKQAQNQPNAPQPDVPGFVKAAPSGFDDDFEDLPF